MPQCTLKVKEYLFSVGFATVIQHPVDDALWDGFIADHLVFTQALICTGLFFFL